MSGSGSAARDAQRTAATYEMWREDRVTQVAVAWVLGTVFVRFCEDNDLIEYPVIAGPGDRVAVARERQGKFFEESPETDRPRLDHRRLQRTLGFPGRRGIV